MRRVLVTGANRGLGLEFVHQLIARGDRVVAACRDPQAATALNALAKAQPKRLFLEPADLADATSIAALAHAVGQTFDGLDLLVNNAGMLISGERFGEVTAEALTSTLQTNAVGAFLLTQALAPLLSNGDDSWVAMISSQLGSIARTDSFYTPSYAISKAALNMATVLLAKSLSGNGVGTIAFHPGWVRTDMGGERAPVQPHDSVAGILRIIAAAKPVDSGTFVDYEGRRIPW